MQSGDTAEVRWKRLGDMLMDAGLITRGQLEEGLAEKDRQKCFLGQALVRLGYLSQDELISFLVKQCKIPHINLVDYRVDPRIVQLLPNALCLQYKLIPIDNLGNILTIAMVNPLDIEALEQARAACPTLKLKPILCTPEHFEIVAQRLLLSDETKAENREAEPLSLSSFGLSALKPAAAPVPVTPKPSPPLPSPAPSRSADEYTVLVREMLGELLNMFQAPGRSAPETAGGPLSAGGNHHLQFAFTLSVGGELCYVSDAVQIVMGYDPVRFQTQFLDLLTDHPGNSVLRRAITLSCAGQQHAPVEAEFQSADGTAKMLHVVLIPVFDGARNLVAVQGVARDVTRRERTEEVLFEAANTDSLTGLLNRRSFMSKLNDLLSLARRHRIPVSVGVVNLDRFTQLNRDFGNDEGDRVLVRLGAILRDSLRSEDSVARSGGDEFCVLMPQVKPDEARHGLIRCRQALAEAPYTASDGRTVSLTVTSGLVSIGEGEVDAAALVERARALVLQGKIAGGDRVVTDPGAL